MCNDCNEDSETEGESEEEDTARNDDNLGGSVWGIFIAEPRLYRCPSCYRGVVTVIVPMPTEQRDA